MKLWLLVLFDYKTDWITARGMLPLPLTQAADNKKSKSRNMLITYSSFNLLLMTCENYWKQHVATAKKRSTVDTIFSRGVEQWKVDH